jgi:hypothetical protein
MRMKAVNALAAGNGQADRWLRAKPKCRGMHWRRSNPTRHRPLPQATEGARITSQPPPAYPVPGADIGGTTPDIVLCCGGMAYKRLTILGCRQQRHLRLAQQNARLDGDRLDQPPCNRVDHHGRGSAEIGADLCQGGRRRNALDAGIVAHLVGLDARLGALRPPRQQIGFRIRLRRRDQQRQLLEPGEWNFGPRCRGLGNQAEPQRGHP